MSPEPLDGNVVDGMLQDINNYVERCWHSYGDYEIYDATDEVEVNGSFRRFNCKCGFNRTVVLGIQISNCHRCGIVMVDRKFDRRKEFNRNQQTGLGDF